MIDKFISSDGITSISGLTVQASCVFCEEGFLSESGLVENMAQTAAAGVGFESKRMGTRVPIGFIASIKNLEVISLPAVGTELRTEVTVINKVLDVTIINGSVSSNGRLYAQCEMRIFVMNETQKSES